MNGLRLVVAALLATPPAVSHAQELGRLFFTPQERAALDAQRRAHPSGKPSSTSVESRRMRLDGYVLRTEGESTVWLNGEPHARESRILRDAEGVGRVTVPGRAAGLRVGESYDSASGEVRDLLGGGKLRVVPMRKARR